jgi:hypothetical protein
MYVYKYIGKDGSEDGSTLLTYNADCAECDWRFLLSIMSNYLHIYMYVYIYIYMYIYT